MAPSIFSRRSVLILWVAFLVVVLYQALGFFPVAAIDGDDAGIAAGAELIASGAPDAREVAYRFEAQPGVYSILVLLRRLVGLRCLEGFALISAVAALAFLLCSALLLADVLGVPVPVCGLALLMLQETLAAGNCANSAAPASAFAIAGLLLLARPGGWLHVAGAGLLIGIGGWLRPDVVAVTPVALVLLARVDRRRALRRLAFAGGVALAAFLLVYTASGCNLGELFGGLLMYTTTAEHKTSNVPWVLGVAAIRTYVAYFAFPVVLLAGYGLLLAAFRRQWHLLALFALGFAPAWLVHASNFTSPRYLYAAIPFLMLPALYGLLFPGRRKAVPAVAVLLLVGQYLVGARLVLRAKPWALEPKPSGLVVWSHEFDQGPLLRASIALGPGTVIPTFDGPRFSSGIAFSPLAWREYKLALATGVARIADYIRDFRGDRLEVCTSSWFARTVVNELLASSGFRLERLQLLTMPGATQLLWRRGGLVVAHTHRQSYADEWSERGRVLDLVESFPVLYVAGGGGERQMLLEKISPRRIVFDSVDGLTAFEIDLVKGDHAKSGAHGSAAFDR